MTYDPDAFSLDDLAILAEAYQDAKREYESLVEMGIWGDELEEAKGILLLCRREFFDAIKEFNDQ